MSKIDARSRRCPFSATGRLPLSVGPGSSTTVLAVDGPGAAPGAAIRKVRAHPRCCTGVCATLASSLARPWPSSPSTPGTPPTRGLRGWGRYARCLLAELRALGDPPVTAIEEGWRLGAGVGAARPAAPAAPRAAPALVHVPNCFLPLRRPCPGVVTVHDLALEAYPEDFAPPDPAQVPGADAPGRPLGRARHLRLGLHARRRVPALRRRRREGARDPAGPRPARRRRRRRPRAPYLLAVGDLRAKKNLAALVAAWLALRGRGPAPPPGDRGRGRGEGARLRALAGAAPLELPGWVDDAGLDALMRGADALVHPSLYEGFGLVVVEAMARGTPVVRPARPRCPRRRATPPPGSTRSDVADMARRHPAGARRPRSCARTSARAGAERAAALSWAGGARATAAVYRELL